MSMQLSNKKNLLRWPVGMFDDMLEIAKLEHRTMSDLVREAMRRYIDDFRRKNPPKASG